MAWKGRTAQRFDIKGTRAVLVNSRLAVKDNPLYQVQTNLISAVEEVDSALDSKVSKTDKINLNEQVTGMLPVQNGGILTGVYLPELTLVANLANASPYYTPWSRYGNSINLINVTGKVSLQPTAPSVLTELGMTIPFASLFEHEEQCSGVASGVVSFGAGTDNFAATVTCDPLTGLALIRWFATGTDTYDVRFNFTYQFIPK